MAGTSFQMLEVLAFCNQERGQLPSITDNSDNLSGEESNRGVYFLTLREKTLNQISYS